MNTLQRTRARIDRALVGELPAPERLELFATLRGDAELRAEYDRAALALRIFEGDAAVASCELDLVESWLVAELDPPVSVVETVRRWLPWRTAFSVAVAAAAALLVVLLARAPGPLPQSDGFTVRGRAGIGALAIDVLCHDAAGALVSAQDAGCDHDDTIAFSYRVQPPAGGVLTLFGVDAHGDPMYYAPTPDDADPIAVKSGDTQPVGAAVMLSVNHERGATRAYGLVSPVAPTVAQVTALAQALATAAPAAPGDPDWLDRVREADAASVRALCPARADCHVAELVFEIRPPPRSR